MPLKNEIPLRRRLWIANNFMCIPAFIVAITARSLFFQLGKRVTRPKQIIIGTLIYVSTVIADKMYFVYL